MVAYFFREQLQQSSIDFSCYLRKQTCVCERIAMLTEGAGAGPTPLLGLHLPTKLRTPPLPLATAPVPQFVK